MYWRWRFAPEHLIQSFHYCDFLLPADAVLLRYYLSILPHRAIAFYTWLFSLTSRFLNYYCILKLNDSMCKISFCTCVSLPFSLLVILLPRGCLNIMLLCQCMILWLIHWETASSSCRIICSTNNHSLKIIWFPDRLRSPFGVVASLHLDRKCLERHSKWKLTVIEQQSFHFSTADRVTTTDIRAH